MELTKLTSLAWLGLVATLAACDRSTQGLPFDVEGETTRTVSGEGGTISSPAGVAFTVPAGALSGPTTITVGTAPVPNGLPGTPSSQAFSIESSGPALSGEAQLEIRLAEAVRPDLAWMASIVGTSGGTIEEYAGGRVDLSTGILTGGVDRFGTFVAVIPPSTAVFPVQSGLSPSRSGTASLASIASIASFAGVTVDSIAVECGPPANRCVGVSARASENLLDLVSATALLYPRLSGDLRIGESAVEGSIGARATLRILLGSGQTAESIEVNALLEPTAETTVVQTPGGIELTNMRHRIGGSVFGVGQSTDEIATLTIPRAGLTGSISVQRSFEIRVAGGALETAVLSFTFPVTLFE